MAELATGKVTSRPFDKRRRRRAAANAAKAQKGHLLAQVATKDDAKSLQVASRGYSRSLCRPDLCQAMTASDHTQVSAVVQELVGGAMAAADAAAAAAVAAAAVAADSAAKKATGRKQLAERKRQRKRHRDRGFHNKRTNKRKNLRRSLGRKARVRTRAQMTAVLLQLSHLHRPGQASEAVEPRNKQALPTPPSTSSHSIYAGLVHCTHI